MKKILFACDLDNTLIHSAAKRLSGDEPCAELLDGKEQSFITAHTLTLLSELSRCDNIFFAPVTTRSYLQYKRIDLHGTIPRYAIAANGAEIITDGGSPEPFLTPSDCETKEILRLAALCEKDENFSKVRFTDEAFLFCHCLEESYALSAKEKYPTFLKAQKTGRKLYFFPQKLTKGSAVKKLAEKIGADMIVAAGDSEIDVSMLNAADIAFIPDNTLADRITSELRICDEPSFSEFILKELLRFNNFQQGFEE